VTELNSKIKTRQTLLLVSGAVLLVAISMGGLWFMDAGIESVKPGEKKANYAITQPGTVEDREAWRAQQGAQLKEFQEKLSKHASSEQQLRSKQEEQDKVIADLKAKLLAEERNKNQTADKPSAGINSSPANPAQAQATQPSGANLAKLNEPLPARGSILNPPGAATSIAVKEPPKRDLEIISFTPASSPKEPTPTVVQTPGSDEAPLLGFPVDKSKAEYGKPTRSKTSGRGDFIPANTFFKAVMLNGVDAPTGGQAQGTAGNAQPVYLEVTDLANLPNLRRLDLRECRLLVAAQGDLSSERTMMRAETLSCVLPDNTTVEMPVKGTVIGPDGKNGVRGRVVSKAGRAIGAQILAEAARGFGNAFRQSATTQVNTPFGVSQSIDSGKLGQAAIGSGVAGGANALAEYYAQLTPKLMPVIETEAGQIVEVALTAGVPFPGKLDQLDKRSNNRRRARGDTYDQDD